MSTAPPPMPSAQPTEPGLSQISRIINTFIAPRKTFEDIKQNASWWAPLVLTSILAIAFHYTIDKKVGFDQISREMMSTSPQFEKQSPEQQQQTLAIVTASTRYGGYAAPLFALIGGIIIAAVLMGTFNFGMQAEVPFSRALAITMYAWLPGMLWSILGLVSLFVGNPETLHFQNPVATNPAYFLDPATTSKFLYTFLTAFDVVSLWIVALLGIGFAVNSKKKISVGTGIMVVAAWFFLVKLLGAGFAAMRG